MFEVFAPNKLTVSLGVDGRPWSIHRSGRGRITTCPTCFFSFSLAGDDLRVLAAA